MNQLLGTIILTALLAAIDAAGYFYIVERTGFLIVVGTGLLIVGEFRRIP